MPPKVNDSFQTILICAVRYALGRRTYMPSLVVDYITPLLPRLSNGTLGILYQDVYQYGACGMHPEAYGEACDQRTWLDFMEKISKEIDGRNEQ